MKYHDFHLDGYTVSDKGRRIVLHLVYDYSGRAREKSHIEFSGVVLYHFVHPAGAIITEIEETTTPDLLAEMGDRIVEWAQLYGVNGWRESLADYGDWLSEAGKKAWRIESAIGFHGIVIGDSVEQLVGMKNIQVIDGAVNAVYDIFAATEDEFALVFPPGEDVAFIDEVMARGSKEELDAAFDRIWQRRVKKSEAMGIHGLLFYELEHKKQYYVTRRDEEAINPNGTLLRSR